jgi:hypothetical protein
VDFLEPRAPSRSGWTPAGGGVRSFSTRILPPSFHGQSVRRPLLSSPPRPGSPVLGRLGSFGRLQTVPSRSAGLPCKRPVRCPSLSSPAIRNLLDALRSGSSCYVLRNSPRSDRFAPKPLFLLWKVSLRMNRTGPDGLPLEPLVGPIA